ncbi:MAG: anti-sigma factor [Actinotalea sp.]|nr:anti-sigma factor [Actinotalea sp.]
MTDDEIRSLLAAYALDAVDADERRAVEDLLARDPEAARELDELRAVTAAMAMAEALPGPPDVRRAVLDEVARTQQVSAADTPTVSAGAPGAGTQGAGAHAAPVVAGRTRPADDTSDRPDRRDAEVVPLTARRRSPRGAWLVAAAAAAVVAVAVPGVVAWQQHERAVQAEARTELLTDLLAEPGATVLSGALTGGGDAVAVLTELRGAVVVEGLPQLDRDLVYQVWAMRDGTPVAAGLLGTGGADAAALLQDYRPGDGVALSVEPAGGSEQPTTTPLVVLLPG